MRFFFGRDYFEILIHNSYLHFSYEDILLQDIIIDRPAWPDVYIKNNADKIVNYRERQKQGLVFTSNLAESTVESLINQRCKGQQHMRWSREGTEGIEPLLQLRAAIASNDWKDIWKTAVLNSVTIHQIIFYITLPSH